MSAKSHFVLTVTVTLSTSILVATILILRPKDVKIGKAALPGDVNGDGVVNILDFQLLSNNFGKTGTVTNTPTPSGPSPTLPPPPPPGSENWISQAYLMKQPTSGSAW